RGTDRGVPARAARRGQRARRRRAAAVRLRRRRRRAGVADRPSRRRRLPGARVQRAQGMPRGPVHRDHRRAGAMSAALLRGLDYASDRRSSIAVREVRQVVRSREFTYAFFASLVAALAIAFFGAADALTGSGHSGKGAVVALMVCVTLIG